MTTNSSETYFNASEFDNITSSSVPTVGLVDQIGYVTVPVFSLFGIVGNVFTIVIMRSKYFCTSTISVYLTALSLSDSLFIFVSPFTKKFINGLFPKDPRALTVAGCKTFFFMFRTAKLWSSWFVVVISIERFAVVTFPFAAKSIFNMRSAKIITFIIIVSIASFDGVWTMTSDIVNGVCIPSAVTENNKGMVTAFIIAGTTIFNIIPTAVLLIFTPLTILTLFRQYFIRREITSSTNMDETFRITRMLVGVMVAYIILVTPISTAHSVAFFNGDNIFESTDPDFIVFRACAQILEQLNYSINFFLYAGFNGTFRRNFLNLIRCQPYDGRQVNERPQSRTISNVQDQKQDTVSKISGNTTTSTYYSE